MFGYILYPAQNFIVKVGHDVSTPFPVAIVEPWNTGNPHLPPGAAVVLVQVSDCSLGLRKH